MSLERVTEKEWRGIKNFCGDTKLLLDCVIDPLAIWVGGNAAYLWVTDKAADYVWANQDDGSGLMTALAYLGIGAGALVVNIGPKIKDKYYGLIGLAKRRLIKNIKKSKRMIKEIKRNPYNREKQKTTRWIGWGKTVVTLATLAALYGPGNLPTTIDKWQWSGKKIVEAGNQGVKTFIKGFAREGYQKEITSKKEMKKPSKSELPKVKLQTKGPFPVPSYIQGKKINSWYSRYTGIEGIAPQTFNPDYVKQLTIMWDSKISNMKKKRKMNRVVEEAREIAIREYSSLKKPTLMTLAEYEREADKSIEFINKRLDWKGVASYYGLKSTQIDLVKRIAHTITGKDLMAYGLTELMPSATDGKLNRLFLDMLLRTAGREFIEFIPAMGDELTSWGFYQFTSEAVYSVEGEKKGASRINQSIPKKDRIPDSVIKLRGNDHHTAAYMFAINNIAELVRKTRNNRKLMSILNENYENKDAIIQFIATAHYNPTKAIKAAGYWLDNNCKKDFIESCSPGIMPYARKTKTNFKAMYGNVPYKTIPRK